MPLFTNGFASQEDLEEHFDKHVVIQNEFPHITTEAEYLAEADSFLGGPLPPNTREARRRKTNSGPDVIRYNWVSQQYGIISAARIIISYYILDPAEHRFRTNLDYYNWDRLRKT